MLLIPLSLTTYGSDSSVEAVCCGLYLVPGLQGLCIQAFPRREHLTLKFAEHLRPHPAHRVSCFCFTLNHFYTATFPQERHLAAICISLIAKNGEHFQPFLFRFLRIPLRFIAHFGGGVGFPSLFFFTSLSLHIMYINPLLDVYAKILPNSAGFLFIHLIASLAIQKLPSTSRSHNPTKPQWQARETSVRCWPGAQENLRAIWAIVVCLVDSHKLKVVEITAHFRHKIQRN